LPGKKGWQRKISSVRCRICKRRMDDRDIQASWNPQKEER
jgi:hypothetical protein